MRRSLPTLPMSNWMYSADYVEEQLRGKVAPQGSLGYADLGIKPAKVRSTSGPSFAVESRNQDHEALGSGGMHEGTSIDGQSGHCTRRNVLPHCRHDSAFRAAGDRGPGRCACAILAHEWSPSTPALHHLT